MNKFLDAYKWICFLLVFFLCVISWVVSTDILKALFFFTTSPEFPTQKGWISFILSFGFSSFMISSFSIMQLIAPLLSVLLISNFVIYKNGVFHYVPFRSKSYREFIWKNIFVQLSLGCFFMYLAYVLVIMFGLITHPIVIDKNYSRSLFAEFFGNDFSYMHPVSYFMLEGIIKFFLFPFVYGLFGISISFITSKKYFYILIPPTYYILSSIIFIALSDRFGYWFKILSPISTLMAGAEGNNIMLIFALTPLLVPLIFSIIAIEYSFRRSERVMA